MKGFKSITPNVNINFTYNAKKKHPQHIRWQPKIPTLRNWAGDNHPLQPSQFRLVGKSAVVLRTFINVPSCLGADLKLIEHERRLRAVSDEDPNAAIALQIATELTALGLFVEKLENPAFVFFRQIPKPLKSPACLPDVSHESLVHGKTNVLADPLAKFSDRLSIGSFFIGFWQNRSFSTV